MIYLITVLVLLFNIILNDSKYVKYINFIYFIIVLGWSYGSYDTMIFINRYQYPEMYSSFTEPLFNYIVNFFNKLHFDYRAFLVLCSFFEILIIFKFIKKKSTNLGFVFALFMIFPMISMFAQLRFLLGFSIVLFAIYRFLLEKPKFYIIKYIIAILIATGIHSACAFYLIFIASCFLDNKKSLIFSFGMFALFFSTQFFSPLMSLLTMIVGEQKSDVLINATTGGAGTFGRCIFIAFIIIGYLIYYLIFLKANKKNNEFDDMLFKINIISIVTIPLLILFSSGFYRISQSLLLLNYVSMTNFIKFNGTCIRKKELLALLFCFSYAIILFVFQFHTKEMFDLVVRPFFEQNEFLGGFLNG